MTSAGPDLSACDREPIHLIGSIQPHGALLALDAGTLTIDHVSANSGHYIGAPPERLIGLQLDDLVTGGRAGELRDRNLIPLRPEILKPWFVTLAVPGAAPRDLECLPHCNNGRIILDLLPREQRPAAVWERDDLRQRVIAELVRPDTLAELAQVSADIVRSVIGFDRVMIYRFADDKHGEVIAESTVRDDSFLGLHYPASDIPEPARRHFVLNVIRTIPDINAPPVPILGAAGKIAGPASEDPLDLTYSKLRAVSPVHVEYLNNMGVNASISISLVTGDQLWGLVACHHYAPRPVAASQVRFLELLGGTISALLQGVENRMQLRRSIDAERTAFDIEHEGRASMSMRRALSDWAPELMQLLDAQGIVLQQMGEIAEFGRVPLPRLDFAPLRGLQTEGITATDHLSAVIPMDEAQWQVAAGAAYLELSDDGRDYLAFLREHYEQTIKWAGRPDKVEVHEADGVVRLSPRGSFALWREERVGRSRPFDKTDREVMRIVRRALFALNSLERERAAVRAQREAEAQEQRLRVALLDAARKASMGELATALAHELNQPLAAVTNYVNACRQELTNFGMNLPDEIDRIMREAVNSAGRAADLVRRLRDFISRGEIESEEVDLHGAIRQGVELAVMANPKHPPIVRFDFDEDLPTVRAEPVQMVQVILNLAQNAITAMQASDPCLLTVRTRRAGTEVQVSVRDTGPGVAREMRGRLFDAFHSSTTGGMGIGLSLCRSIVEAHGGRIWLSKATDGAEVTFSIPIEGQDGRDG